MQMTTIEKEFYFVSDPVLVEKMYQTLVEKYGYFQPSLEDVELDRWTLPDVEYHEWTLDSVSGHPVAYGHVTDKFFHELKTDEERGFNK